MVHRPQRSERKDPFPQIPYTLDCDHSTLGDTFVGWVCVVAAILLLVLAWSA